MSLLGSIGGISAAEIRDLSLDGGTPVQPQDSGAGNGFAKALEQLGDLQSDGATASRALATGQAADPESVVMAVERARLSMQLASQLRNKAVEAFTDIFHTQV
jgi:flagellar hook-basal body complex protein FliE